MERPGGPLPPVYLLGTLLLSVLLHLVLPIARPIPGLLRWLGWIPLAVGVTIAARASRRFDARGTTVRPFEESTVLVTEDLYRYTRNPMYLGMILLLIGVDTLLGSLSPFLLIPPFGRLLQERFIRREEAMLETRFGDEYRAYRARVRRWI